MPPTLLSACLPAARRASYAVVGAAVAVGLLVPAWAGWVLGPALLPGLVLLGVAHGACDQLVLPATHPTLARRLGCYWAVFLGGLPGAGGGGGAAVVVAPWAGRGLVSGAVGLALGVGRCPGGRPLPRPVGWPTACCAGR